MTELQKKLIGLADRKYAEFSAKLTPNVDPALFLGVRVPVLRKVARDFSQTQEVTKFLTTLPHEFYDENLLHAILLSHMSNFEACIEAVERFLPHVDNWAVCDTLSPRVFANHKQELLPYIDKWIQSPHTYTCRFGIGMLMSHFLDEDFSPEHLDKAASATSDEYYIKMMVAWYFATALAKQWDTTIAYLEQSPLAPWTHNKTIQKSCESLRLTPDQKEYLKGLRVK